MEVLLVLWLAMVIVAIIDIGIALLKFVGSIFFADEKAVNMRNSAKKLLLNALMILLIGGGVCFGAIFLGGR